MICAEPKQLYDVMNKELKYSNCSCTAKSFHVYHRRWNGGEELKYTTPNINVLMIFNAFFAAKLGPLLSKEGAVLAVNWQDS